MKASILIPAYNAAQYLEATLLSCADQGADVIEEIIVVDDHSEDDSQAVFSRVAKAHPEFAWKWFTNPNKGACSARNHALTMATGDWIQWLDADDILGTSKIRTQLNSLGCDSLSCCVSPFVPFVGSTKTGLFQDDRNWNCPTTISGADWLASGRMTIPACWIGPKAVFDQAGPWDESLKINQDGEYFSRVLAKAESVFFESEVNVWYRRGVSGSVSQFTSEKAESLFASVDSIHRTALALEDSPRMRLMVANRYQYAIYTSYPHYPEGLEKAKKELRNLPKPTISNPNAVSPLSKFISNVFGWKALTQLRLLLNKRKL